MKQRYTAATVTAPPAAATATPSPITCAPAVAAASHLFFVRCHRACCHALPRRIPPLPFLPGPCHHHRARAAITTRLPTAAYAYPACAVAATLRRQRIFLPPLAQRHEHGAVAVCRRYLTPAALYRHDLRDATLPPPNATFILLHRRHRTAPPPRLPFPFLPVRCWFAAASTALLYRTLR